MRTAKRIIDIIGFPFSIMNSFILKKRKQKEPGQLVKIGERFIHIIETGNTNAEFTVILDAGLSCCSLDWYYIQPEVSKFARVVSFDRAGYGWSSPAIEAYTSEDVVQDLKQALNKLSIRPPFILVGHSFGSLNMRLFTSQFPEEVAGMLLIDPVHENRYLSKVWDQNREKEHRKSLQLFRIGFLTSGLGIPRLLKKPVGRKRLPEPFQKNINYIGYHPNSFEAVYKEFLYSEKSAQQVAQSAPLKKDLPITILSSKNNDPNWVEQQKLLTKLTEKTIQIKTDNNHSIHLENPKLVIKEIKRLIERG